MRILPALALALTASPVLAEIEIEDPYARASNPMAGAAFMVIRNTGEADDRLLSVSSEAAKRVELHTHSESDNGIMKMHHVEEGFPIPAGGAYPLERGGDHVMFMGLTEPFEAGDTVSVTLHFEHAGEVALDIPVDLER